MRWPLLIYAFLSCLKFMRAQDQTNKHYKFTAEANIGYSYLLGSKARPYKYIPGSYVANRTPGYTDDYKNFFAAGIVVYSNSEKHIENIHIPYYLSFGFGFTAINYSVKRSYHDYHFNQGNFSDNLVCQTKQNLFTVQRYLYSLYVLKHDISDRRVKVNYKFGISILSSGTTKQKPLDYTVYGTKQFGYYYNSNAYNYSVAAEDSYNSRASFMMSLALPYTFYVNKNFVFFGEPGVACCSWKIDYGLSVIKGMGTFLDLKAGLRYNF